MARILAAAFSFLAGLLPLCAVALGLGDIDLKSALDQPFRAEIPISADGPENLSQVKVTLASQETFDRYGLGRPLFITDFEFSVGLDGMIRIASRQPVIEPFVTLLIDVKWPQGRLLREYTVLLDPPVFSPNAVEQPVSAPRQAVAAAPSRPATPAITPAPRSPASSPRVSTPVSFPRADAPSGESQVRVQRSDTLWGIAGRLRQETSVDMNQMMLAIYRANPEAFSGNINRLKAGAILRVPDADEVLALNRQDAMREVRQQNESWSGSTRRESPRLRLVPPDETGDSALSSRTGTAGRTRADAAEAEFLTERVEDLESELEESRRLLQLRDNELRNLQNQLARLEDQKGGATEVVPLPGATEPFADSDAEETVADSDAQPAESQEPESAAEEPAAVEVTEPPATAPRGSAVTTTTGDEPSWLETIGALFSSIWLYLAVGVTLIVGLLLRFARRRSESADDDTGQWQALSSDEDESVDSISHEATARMRAGQQDATIVVEETPATEETADGLDFYDDQAPASSDIPPAEADLGEAIEEELPFERTISSDAALDLDTADPVAEADFHMAYGLYDQAADLLNSALGSEPERQDLRFKLLEVYFIWENQGGFLKEAQAFADRTDIESDSEWNKVLIMGQQICPDEALFSGTPEAPSMDESVDLAFGADDDAAAVIDFQLDDEGGGSQVDVDLTGERLAIGQEDDEVVLDFDLGANDEAAMEIEGTVDLDVGSADSPTMETPTVEAAAHDAPTMESPELAAAGGDSPTMETPTIETPSMDATAETPTIESPAAGVAMDIGELPDEDAGTISESTAELELDDLGLDIDGLDDAAADLTAGLDALDEDDVTIASDTVDLGDDEDETLLASGAEDADLAALDDDVTSEVEAIDVGADDPLDLDVLTTALEKSSIEEGPGGDTVEQPVVDETAEQPKLDIIGESATDVDIGEAFVDEAGPTEVLGEAASQPPDGPTMTEVGTKLDLARAYIDMGDPDGARSILNEVLGEGADEQKQEAQKLLDDLG